MKTVKRANIGIKAWRELEAISLTLGPGAGIAEAIEETLAQVRLLDEETERLKRERLPVSENARKRIDKLRALGFLESDEKLLEELLDVFVEANRENIENAVKDI